MPACGPSASAAWSTSKASACRATRPEQAPKRFVQWLDDLKAPQALRAYAEPARPWPRACARPTRCCAPIARPGWRRTGRASATAPMAPACFELLADPAHKRSNADALPRRRGAGVLEADHARRCCGSRATRPTSASGGATATPRPSSTSGWRSCRTSRRTCCRPAGHMLHHDQPEALAERLGALSRRETDRSAHAKIDALRTSRTSHAMDVEHINAIGNTLADLTPAHRRPPGVSLTTIAKRCD